ncbi:hypothetical protein OE88DRAFT_1664310 [Heliocybe sulcata]|uniref:Yeast cell wall synthesis Kre9/Knh1-like N-terminal domain-containing protein n=1 Tax=Heliocybe sulcata TaxID=5364 RepID=A0A5C3MWD6_9AGAM|nr:hypothetical protein OE88DRAFT_1664310 [Heliocybe sulcata]
MLSVFAVTALLASSLVARADPTPSEPGPGSVFNEGSTCHIAWSPDTTGSWKQMSIELMTGDNWNMVHLTTVTTLDGTDTATTTYDFPCPSVTPNAPIYFYQFSDPSSSDKTWTTRFTIADASGNQVPAPNTTQPDGQSIGWGVGALTDPSSGTPAPSGSSTASGSTSSSGTVSSGPPSGSSAASSSSGATPAGTATGTGVGSSSTPSKVTTKSASTAAASVTPNGSSNTTTTAGAADSGAAMVGGAAGVKMAAASLAVTALVFVVGL